MTGHWAFVAAAYAVMLVSVAGLVAASYCAMQRAER
jgi:heme exporter protein D